jgi:PAS domain S-box-containing protein
MVDHRLHALLVEDDDAYAAMVQAELSLSPSLPVWLERARSLSDAIQKLSGSRVDAILLDLGLPDSSGLNTFNRIQAAAGDLPVLVLTARDDDELAIAAVQAGAQDYLVKSSTDAQLLSRALRYACERAQFHRTLVEREARFRALVDQSHEAITLMDTNLTALYNSRAVETVCGYRPEELFGRRLDTLVHPEDLPSVIAAIDDSVARPGAALRIEYRFKHKNGTWRFAEAILINHLQDAAVQAIVVNHRDVTLRKEAEQALRVSEERLRQAHKMEAVGRLAGGVAHDFNNVLTAIFGYTDLLLEQFPDDDPRRSDVVEIRRSAERAAALTRQLLAFSRKQVLQPRILVLNEVLASLELLLLRLMGDQVALIVHASPDLWKVRADPGQIEQVLMNLCANAKDAMPEGGAVRITTANRFVGKEESGRRPGLQPGEYVLLTVADTGVGIAEEVRPYVFEPFFTTKEQGKGTGLGLATVYGIIKQSGGGVYLDSAEGTGTTFSIYLPAISSP